MKRNTEQQSPERGQHSPESKLSSGQRRPQRHSSQRSHGDWSPEKYKKRLDKFYVTVQVNHMTARNSLEENSGSESAWII
jgi:ribosomal protein L44E